LKYKNQKNKNFKSLKINILKNIREKSELLKEKFGRKKRKSSLLIIITTDAIFLRIFL